MAIFRAVARFFDVRTRRRSFLRFIGICSPVRVGLRGAGCVAMGVVTKPVPEKRNNAETRVVAGFPGVEEAGKRIRINRDNRENGWQAGRAAGNESRVE